MTESLVVYDAVARALAIALAFSPTVGRRRGEVRAAAA
jgi:hypothetical protein